MSIFLRLVYTFFFFFERIPVPGFDFRVFLAFKKNSEMLFILNQLSSIPNM